MGIVLTIIQAAINALEAKGVFETTMFTPSDPAGIFELYIDPDTSLGDFYKGKFISVSTQSSLRSQAL